MKKGAVGSRSRRAPFPASSRWFPSRGEVPGQDDLSHSPAQLPEQGDVQLINHA